jgi:hypothetical protein
MQFAYYCFITAIYSPHKPWVVAGKITGTVTAIVNSENTKQTGGVTCNLIN